MRCLSLILTSVAVLALSSAPTPSQVSEEWVVRFDAEANVYVTGHSWDPYYGADYATVKYGSVVATAAEGSDGDAAGERFALGPPARPRRPGGSRCRSSFRRTEGPCA